MSEKTIIFPLEVAVPIKPNALKGKYNILSFIQRGHSSKVKNIDTKQSNKRNNQNSKDKRQD